MRLELLEKKYKLEPTKFQVGIIIALVLLQLVVPLIGLACDDFLILAAQNNKSCKSMDASVQSCCNSDRLLKQGSATYADEKDATKQHNCNVNCNNCFFGCCGGTAIGVLPYGMSILASSETSIIPLGTPPHKAVTPRGIFRPPRT
jgi:hypothetical protein